MFKVLSVLVLLASLGYWWYQKQQAEEGNSFEDWDFNKEQVRMLRSLGITASELSSLASTMSLGALVAGDIVQNFTDTLTSQLENHREEVGKIYRCYRAELDVGIKVLAHGFPKQSEQLAKFLAKSPKPTSAYDCKKALGDVRRIFLPKSDTWLDLWKEHGGMISLAKTFFPEKVYSPVESFVRFLFVNDDGSKDEKKNGNASEL